MQFIPLAEETGLILPLGEWVLRTACLQAVSWPEAVGVAVNLSATQFKGRNLVQLAMNALASTGLAASRLDLEITELVLLQDEANTLAVLHQLRDIGIRISLDDFGTGYSSLAYLRNFPFDKIKIDRSFVQDMLVRKDCQAIVRAVVGLAQSLSITTIIEGVETKEQFEAAKNYGCNEGQGYLFSKPMPNSESQPFSPNAVPLQALPNSLARTRQIQFVGAWRFGRAAGDAFLAAPRLISAQNLATVLIRCSPALAQQ